MNQYNDWFLPMTPQEEDIADVRISIDPEFSQELVAAEVIPIIIHQVESDCKVLDSELAKINADIQHYYNVTDAQHSPDIAGRIKDGYLTDWLLIINRRELFKFVRDGKKIKLLRPVIRHGVLTIEGILQLRNQVAFLRRLIPRLIKLAAIIDVTIGMNRMELTQPRTSESRSASASGSRSVSASGSRSVSVSGSRSVSGAVTPSEGLTTSSELLASGSEASSSGILTASSELLASGSGSETMSASESAAGSGTSSRSGSAAGSELQ